MFSSANKFFFCSRNISSSSSSSVTTTILLFLSTTYSALTYLRERESVAEFFLFFLEQTISNYSEQQTSSLHSDQRRLSSFSCVCFCLFIICTFFFFSLFFLFSFFFLLFLFVCCFPSKTINRKKFFLSNAKCFRIFFFFSKRRKKRKFFFFFFLFVVVADTKNETKRNETKLNNKQYRTMFVFVCVNARARFQ